MLKISRFAAIQIGLGCHNCRKHEKQKHPKGIGKLSSVRKILKCKYTYSRPGGLI